MKVQQQIRVAATRHPGDEFSDVHRLVAGKALDLDLKILRQEFSHEYRLSQ
jgi:hypothetical protein